MCGSAFGATAHDDAHGVFMTLPAYTSIRESEAPQLGSGPTPCRVGKCREEMPSSKYEGRIEHVGPVHRERWHTNTHHLQALQRDRLGQVVGRRAAWARFAAGLTS
jgi:hypothetical protein